MQEAAATGLPPAGAILISHTHWDHIHGIPFFAPLFVPGSRWDVFGPRGLVRTLDHALAGQMEYQYFPVGLDELSAEIRYHDLVEGVFEVGDATVRTQYLNHPALTLGYRIDADGATVVYATDHEPHDRALAGGGRPRDGGADARHAAFLGGADVVIHDTQYDVDGYSAKVGWGHSTMEYAVDLAAAAGARRLVLFHHDPQRSDDDLDALLVRARAMAAASGTALEVDAAAEGATIDVVAAGEASPRLPSAAEATAVPAVEHLATGVAVATSDPALEATVGAAAAAEGLEVRPPDGDLADAVVVVDLDDDGALGRVGGGLAVLGATRRAAPVPAPADDHRLAGAALLARARPNEAAVRRAPSGMSVVGGARRTRRAGSSRCAPQPRRARHTPEERFDQFVEQARRDRRDADRTHHPRGCRTAVVQGPRRLRHGREPPRPVDLRVRDPGRRHLPGS